ncbi:MAG: alpha/beta fold hydrolase, partial [Candidatus Kapaibacterium sp.]
FSNPLDSVAAWCRELESYIDEVLRRTGANKVTLVGYSMGGIASRLYLTRHLRDHRVQRLITIGSPHLGSPFARVYTVKSGIKNALAGGPNPVSEALLRGALSAVEACETDMPFDSPAMRDLIPPDNAGNFLDRLGKAPHPQDVEYISVIGNVDVIGDAQKFRSSALQEVLRRVGEFFDNGVNALLTPGDGVVSTSSQVLTNIPWFADKQENVRLARTVTLKSVHTQHLQKSPEIQRVTLESKPELHGSEWYMVNGVPSLVLTYTDYLQPSSSVCTVTYDGMAGERTVQATQQKLVTLSTGERVGHAVIPMGDADFSSPFTARFSIRNAYGYTVQATKQWQPLPDAPK